MRERVTGSERDHEPLAHQEMGARHVGRRPGALEHDREVELSAVQFGHQLVRRPLVEVDAKLGITTAQSIDDPGHEARQRGRKGSDPQPCVPAGEHARHLALGELQPLGDHVGVLEHDPALGGELQAPRAPLQQRRAELSLELGDLVGYGRLRQRQVAGGMGERTPLRDGTEGQYASRSIVSVYMCDRKYDLSL